MRYRLLLCGTITALMAVSCGAAERPLTPQRQAELMQQAAALYIQWPENRVLPIPSVIWRSPEWFAIRRPGRLVWGTIDEGKIVLNERVLTDAMFSDTTVLESILVHEHIHILQEYLTGPLRTCEDMNRREIEAYSVQRAWLQIHHGSGLMVEYNPVTCTQ